MSRKLRLVHVLDNLNTGGTELNAVRTAERLDRARFDVRFLCLQADGPLRARLDAAGIPVTEIGVSSVLSFSAMRRVLEIRDLVRRERFVVVHAHHRVLANSPAVGELVVREEGVSREQLVVIPNFVDEAAFTPLAPARRAALRQQVGLTDSDVAVGIVANLYPVKDHATLLRAAGRLAGRWPGVRFVLVGEGQEREPLRKLASDLGIADRILMPGRVAPEPGLGGIFDIATLTSREEGFPNWVVEAMAAGRAVVATDVGGVSDAVVEGETGLLVPRGDDERLAAALDRLLGDEELRFRLGTGGTSRARQMYHVDSVMQSLEKLYEDLAIRHGQG